VNVPDALFLGGLSLLLVGIAAFSVLVAWSGLRRSMGRSVTTVPGLRATLRALELSPGIDGASGRWSFYLHRLSGVGLLGFLALHVVDVSLVAFSANLYNRVHKLYGTPVLRVLESGLVFAVLFHTLNGVRLLMVDGLNLRLHTARRSLVVVAVLSLIGGLAASVIILAPVV
jgi:succinate dehydrogenase / fumarate reductase cytochrome b subunit